MQNELKIQPNQKVHIISIPFQYIQTILIHQQKERSRNFSLYLISLN